MKLKKVAPGLVLMVAMILPAVGWGHGDDKPGPHGGIVRMPGALHTELLPLNDHSFAVYLLDLSFKDPIVLDSSVEASVRVGAGVKPLTCKADTDRFVCALDPATALDQGMLLLNARRKGVASIEMQYELPFGSNVEGHRATHKEVGR